MNDERAAEGIEHLQAAALEMISAARAFLDIAEELVADKDKMSSVADAVGSAVRGAASAVRTEGDAGLVGSADAVDDARVQHIKVS